MHSVSEFAREPVEKENTLIRRGVSTCQQQMELLREPADVDLSIYREHINKRRRSTCQQHPLVNLSTLIFLSIENTFYLCRTHSIIDIH